ncbi:MAG: hypothetical protein ACKV2T_00265 [Kofleriaceae bacterium]
MRFSLLLLLLSACEVSDGTFSARHAASPRVDDQTWCTTIELDNPSPIVATEILAHFDAVDRVVIYRAAEGDVVGARDECSELAQGAPLAIAKYSGDGLRLDAHGFSLAPRQRLRIEAQSSERATGEIRIDVEATHDPMATPVEILEIDRDDVVLAPNQAGTASTFLTLPSELAGARFVAFAAHTGKDGVAAQVATAASPTGDRILVHFTTAHRWTAPEVTTTPPTRIPDGGGIYVQCHYYNTSNDLSNEVCGAWAYFAP